MKLKTNETEDVGNVSGKEFRLNLLTQEIKFAKMLASNELNAAVKEKHIKKLSTWLRNRASCSQEFTDKDCLRLWKGLFYSMWMSDKPLPQETLATKIASLLHSFDRYESSLQFFAMFLKTMATEWNGIDQWRIDKFMMLVRRVTREMLRIVQAQEWSADAVGQLSKRLTETVLGKDTPRGLFMHFTELFFEEVSKVSLGEIDADSVTELLRPFMFYVASQSDYKLIQFVVKSVFNYLLFQSDTGREYKEKFDAWKEMGFPGNSVDDLELVDDQIEEEGGDGQENDAEDDEDKDEEGDEDDEEEDDGDGDETEETAEQKGALDPRAGRVDVSMPEIKFNPLQIVRILEEMKYKKFTNTRNRKCIDRIVSTFTNFSGGTFPLGIQRLKVKRDELELPDSDDKAVELMEFEESLYGEQRELKKMNKRKRKKVLSNPSLYDEFQETVKSKKPRLSLNSSSVWNEEDIEEEQNYSVEPLPKKVAKEPKRKSVSSGFTETDQEPAALKKKQLKQVEAPKKIVEIPKTVESPKKLAKIESAKPNGAAQPPKSPKSMPSTPKQANGVADENETPKLKKKIAQNGWTEPLQEGEVEYFVPSSKGKANGLERTVKTSEIETPKKIAKTPAAATPNNRLSVLKTSLDGLSSAEKKVKINLKNNISQEATEYIKQLKQSPSVPFDSAQKPPKGVLKPNLMPSPINPFYKKMIGFMHPHERQS